jgi:alpha-tubulin suppressor-like RCC1 family protein
MRDGSTVKCWGSGGALGGTLDRGFVNVLPPAGQMWTRLWGGARGNCGLTTNGGIACWGRIAMASQGMPTVVTGTEVHDIGDADVGNDAICLTRTTDSARVCWGANNVGQMGDTTANTIATPTAYNGGEVGALSFITSHLCMVTLGGNVKCWGLDQNGNAAVTPPANPYAIRTPTTVLGSDGMPLANCTKVATGNDHSCALCDGNVTCWGQDAIGATGIPDSPQPDYLPQPIAITGKSFVDLVAKALGGCARTADGEIYCWGAGGFGSNGDGGQDRNLPTDITTRF